MILTLRAIIDEARTDDDLVKVAKYENMLNQIERARAIGRANNDGGHSLRELNFRSSLYISELGLRNLSRVTPLQLSHGPKSLTKTSDGIVHGEKPLTGRKRSRYDSDKEVEILDSDDNDIKNDGK